LEHGEGTRVPFLLVLPVAGLSAQAELVVSECDTARSVGTGNVAVLATPRIVALCEQGVAEAVNPLLEPGQTSVGFRVEITHLTPVLVGRRVVASAAIERV
jgi:fluoroacetyl-CoA thioesterase